jgi:predicted ribonuclease YlaK
LIKNFVLDTNVLLHDPNAIYKFQDNRVFIPITVIEELDHFKKDLNMLGRNARTVSKFVDKCTTACGGSPKAGGSPRRLRQRGVAPSHRALRGEGTTTSSPWR